MSGGVSPRRPRRAIRPGFRSRYRAARPALAGCLVALILLGAVVGASAQQPPIVSGGAGFLAQTQAGATYLQPVIAPVVAAPLGEHWLFESRSDLRGFISHPSPAAGDGNSGYDAQFFGTLEYLQADYLVNSRLTLVAGRFLSPFGIFNERLSALWIDKFQTGPIISAIGVRGGYADGVMLRGVALTRPKLQLNYVLYEAVQSAVHKLESTRAEGGRAGVFLPTFGLEFGGSFARSPKVGGDSEDVYGAWVRGDWDVKGEAARALGGRGDWIQAAYRLARGRGPDSPLGRLEPVWRWQQFHRVRPMAGDFLPGANLREEDYGVNYYLPQNLRLNVAYLRSQGPGGAPTSWQLGLTYRFLLPL